MNACQWRCSPAAAKPAFAMAKRDYEHNGDAEYAPYRHVLGDENRVGQNPTRFAKFTHLHFRDQPEHVEALLSRLLLIRRFVILRPLSETNISRTLGSSKNAFVLGNALASCVLVIRKILAATWTFPDDARTSFEFLICHFVHSFRASEWRTERFPEIPEGFDRVHHVTLGSPISADSNVRRPFEVSVVSRSLHTRLLTSLQLQSDRNYRPRASPNRCSYRHRSLNETRSLLP